MPFPRMNASGCILSHRTLADAISSSGKQEHQHGEMAILSFMIHAIMSIVEALLV
jgi:hypothetical protein